MASASSRNAATKKPPNSPFYALIDYEDDYVQPLLLSTFRDLPCEVISTIAALPTHGAPVVQYRAYESLDFDHALSHPSTSLVNSYIIRKALIRKHYLSHTISNWLVKNPHSILKQHFKASVDFEVDYAEFLDEALVEAWELHESFARNAALTDETECQRETWILKPGMSDRGQGIRLFSTMEDLQSIFEGWDPESDDEDEEEVDDSETGEARPNATNTQGIVTSHLRHFVAQPYIHPPLHLRAEAHRKFHIRVYVLAVGALKVYVYPEMLALFAAEEYHPPIPSGPGNDTDELARHLTNTCLQDGTREGSVKRFWDLPSPSTSPKNAHVSDWKQHVFSQICAVTGEVFEAAARGQMVHFQPLPNAFEVFGLDFLVDDGLGAWLLEINAFPDLKQTGEDLKERVVGGLVGEIIRVAVGGFFGIDKKDDGVDDELGIGSTKRMSLVKEIDLGRR